MLCLNFLASIGTSKIWTRPCLCSLRRWKIKKILEPFFRPSEVIFPIVILGECRRKSVRNRFSKLCIELASLVTRLIIKNGFKTSWSCLHLESQWIYSNPAICFGALHTNGTVLSQFFRRFFSLQVISKKSLQWRRHKRRFLIEKRLIFCRSCCQNTRSLYFKICIEWRLCQLKVRERRER